MGWFPCAAAVLGSPNAQGKPAQHIHLPLGPHLFGGAYITEKVFGWPGMGLLGVEAIANRDYQILMGLTLFTAILVMLGNLLSDIMYSVVDPRIRY